MFARQGDGSDDGTPVPFRRSPNQSTGTITPRFLVFHYTAGGSAESTINWLCDKRAKASAHLVVGRDGSITQLVDFNRKAWHAGASTWRGVTGLNSHSIGIELANVGPLQKTGEIWRSAWGNTIADHQVVVATHPHENHERGWEAYPAEQLRVARQLALTLVTKYGLEEVVGHQDIAPGRKLDPGPAFPLDGMAALVRGRGAEEGDLKSVTASLLNIRTGPGTDFDKVDGGPLPEGTFVKGLAQADGWQYVEVIDDGGTTRRGWVVSRYLRPV